MVVGKDDNHTDGRESKQLEKHFIISRTIFQYLPRSLVDGMCHVSHVFHVVTCPGVETFRGYHASWIVLEQALDSSLV